MRVWMTFCRCNLRSSIPLLHHHGPLTVPAGVRPGPIITAFEIYVAEGGAS